MAKENKGQYNWIYKDLVSDNNDIVGHIAYSIYKREKIDHIEDLKKNNNGADPTFEDLAPFRMMAGKRKSEYTEAAQRVLQKYITDVGIEYEKANHGFLYGVLQSLVANLIWLGFAVLFYLAVKNGWISLPNVSIQ